MTNTPTPVAVVLGNAATGLYVARELGRAGLPVRGVSRRLECGGVSKYLQDYTVCRTSAETLDFLIHTVANERTKPILIPASDYYIDFVASNATLLFQHFSFQNSYTNGLAQRLVTKSDLYNTCTEHDVPLPGWLLATPKTLDLIADTLTFPIFVKPNKIHQVKHTMKGQKGWVVQKKEDLNKIDLVLPPGNHTFIAQEIIPGPEFEYISLLCLL